jgi:deazaflavin-dependent oxidoreductase (nitroreductase family)
LLNRAVGLPILELITTGRRSGLERSVLLTYLDVDDGFVVIASNAGDDQMPAWWLNLQASPEARVVVDRHEHPVRAREASGDEREALWDRAVAANRGFEDYRSSTARRFPVVVLEKG